MIWYKYCYAKSTHQRAKQLVLRQQPSFREDGAKQRKTRPPSCCFSAALHMALAKELFQMLEAADGVKRASASKPIFLKMRIQVLLLAGLELREGTSVFVGRGLDLCEAGRVPAAH